MSFVLCHDCFTWVEPEDNHCPECLWVMDLSEVDPPLKQLREVMGELVEPLGDVRIPRRRLPDRGTLYATTEGLFFVPHELDRSLRWQTTQLPGVSPRRILAAFFGFPCRWVMPFLRRTSPQRPAREVHPRCLLDENNCDLAEVLMGNPGAFFLPRRQIQSLFRKRNGWILKRRRGGTLQILPLGPTPPFQERFRQLLQTTAWQTVAH